MSDGGRGVTGNRTRLGRKQLKRWLNGKAIIDIAKNIRKIAHVLVQTWKGWDINGLFRGWFSWLGGIKTIIGVVMVMLAGCVLIPCLMPLLVSTVKSFIETGVERKITTLARRETQRYLNCVTKNYDRMTVASERQLNIIRRLEAHNLLSSLPEELEHTARARLEYPDLPLSLLVTKLPESITKSGLSHRLRRIEELGRELLGLDEE